MLIKYFFIIHASLIMNHHVHEILRVKNFDEIFKFAEIFNFLTVFRTNNEAKKVTCGISRRFESANQKRNIFRNIVPANISTIEPIRFSNGNVERWFR